MGEGEAVTVFRTWSSPFSLRVIWGLKLKGIQYREIFEDLSNKSESLLQYNPVHNKIPVLLHNGKPICESLLILEYLDETWKQPPLLPQHPYQRAMARFYTKLGEEKVLASVRAALLQEGREQEESISAALEGLTYLEKELKGNKFFGGETIGLADLALGWIAYYGTITEEVMGLKLIDPSKFPMLVSWMQEFSEIPIIRESWPDRDKLIAKFSKAREEALGNKRRK